jgi:uroporphyrinogen-III decarboxylase
MNSTKLTRRNVLASAAAMPLAAAAGSPVLAAADMMGATLPKFTVPNP